MSGQAISTCLCYAITAVLASAPFRVKLRDAGEMKAFVRITDNLAEFEVFLERPCREAGG